MKKGDTILVRRPGGIWRRGTVVLASENEASLFLAGDDLPSPDGGLTLHPEFGKALALLRETGDFYTELLTETRFEVRREVQNSP